MLCSSQIPVMNRPPRSPAAVIGAMCSPDRCLPFLLCFAVSVVSAQTEPPESLQRIEQERGGRHWIDQETDPPKSPQDSLACLQIEPGFQVELVAAEPLVKDPVQVAFDERGDLYAIEYGDYPEGPPDGQDPLSRIVMLEDTNGDGIYDRRHVFAEHLNFAHSFMPYRGGLLVGRIRKSSSCRTPTETTGRTSGRCCSTASLRPIRRCRSAARSGEWTTTST